MGASSTRKGKTGEREWATWLRENLGAMVSRGQQGAGGHWDPDVSGVPGWWFEVKRVERLSLWVVLEKLKDDLAQAVKICRATTNEKPIVAFRRNRGRWWVILRAEDWASMVRDLNEAEKELDRHRGHGGMAQAGRP